MAVNYKHFVYHGFRANLRIRLEEVYWHQMDQRLWDAVDKGDKSISLEIPSHLSWEEFGAKLCNHLGPASVKLVTAEKKTYSGLVLQQYFSMKEMAKSPINPGAFIVDLTKARLPDRISSD